MKASSNENKSSKRRRNKNKKQRAKNKNSKPIQSTKKNQVQKILDKIKVDSIASKFNFTIRKKSITLPLFLMSFFSAVQSGRGFSYALWAEYLSLLAPKKKATKSAVFKKVKKELVTSLQAVLEETLHIKLKTEMLTNYKGRTIFSPFGRVYLQDSSIVSLPDELKNYYSGSTSKGIKKSSMRLQTIFDFISGHFVRIDINNFTDNDQKDSPGILKFVKKDDLVIRDLGYFVLRVFSQIASKGAFFISRYHNGTNVYDLNGKKMELEKEFKRLDKKGIPQLDMDVLLGVKEQLECRLIAIKVPEPVAAERKRKARQNRDKRLNHSKAYYKKLEWAIYLTNVERNVYSIVDVAKAYRLRWHIEIIYKGWKSHFNMAKHMPGLPNKKEITKKDIDRLKIRVDAIMLMQLIFAALFMAHIYWTYLIKLYRQNAKLLSYLKVCAYVSEHFSVILEMSDDELMQQLETHATYEKRKRKNTLELFLELDL